MIRLLFTNRTLASSLLLAITFTLQKSIAMAAPSQTEETSATREIPDCTFTLVDHVTLAAERAGVIREIRVAEGDRIGNDELVARLASEEASAHLRLARLAAESDIAIRLAEKTQSVAFTELQQAEELNKRRQIYTEFELRRLRLTLDKTILEAQQAEHDRELRTLEEAVAAATLRSFEIRSTFAGTVVQVFRRPGEAVQQGEPIARIVNTGRLKVEGFAPVQQISDFHPGQKISVVANDVSPAVVLQGQLRFVDVSVQSVTQEVRIWAEVDNSAGLARPGLSATLRIHSDTPAAVHVSEAEASPGIKSRK